MLPSGGYRYTYPKSKWTKETRLELIYSAEFLLIVNQIG